MKKQRLITLLVLFLIVFALGTGYAISTKTLNIVGIANVTAEDTNFIVRFEKKNDTYTTPTIKGTNTTATGDDLATASVTGDYDATIKVSGLKKQGDIVEVTYTVENQSNNLDAEIVAAVATTGDTGYFTVETTGITTTKSTLKCGASTTVTVKVTLNKTPVENKEININVTLTATPVEAA